MKKIIDYYDTYVEIPVYVGKYVAKTADWWWLHSWSDWSTTKKTNPYFYTYNGTDTATEYDTESRTEHQYYRFEEQTKYDTLYHTEYKGTSWYNKLFTFEDTSWTGYPNPGSGYTITRRYTTREAHGTIQVKVITAWDTDAPFTWPWETSWTVYSTRTTYRYRSRTLVWDSQYSWEYELVPKKYSLYSSFGKPISNGIKWTYSSDLSNDGIYNGLGYQVSNFGAVYYIPVAELVEDLAEKLEDYEDSIGSNELYGIITSFADGMIGTLAIPEPVSKPAGIALSTLTLLVSLHDWKLSNLKQEKVNSYQDVLNKLKKSNKVLVITDENRATFTTGKNYQTNTKYTQSSVMDCSDLTFVSMNATDNGYGQSMNLSGDSYGTISYGIDIDEVFSALEWSLKYNYPILLPWNY